MQCETHIVEPKNVGLYTWRGEGRGSEKVYCLYTYENVDIFGWPLRAIKTSRINGNDWLNNNGNNPCCIVQWKSMKEWFVFSAFTHTNDYNYKLPYQTDAAVLSSYIVNLLKASLSVYCMIFLKFSNKTHNY